MTCSTCRSSTTGRQPPRPTRAAAGGTASSACASEPPYSAVSWRPARAPRAALRCARRSRSTERPGDGAGAVVRRPGAGAQRLSDGARSARGHGGGRRGRERRRRVTARCALPSRRHPHGCSDAGHGRCGGDAAARADGNARADRDPHHVRLGRVRLQGAARGCERLPAQGRAARAARRRRPGRGARRGAAGADRHATTARPLRPHPARQQPDGARGPDGADRARARGAHAARLRPLERGARRAPVRERDHGQDPRLEHPAQARPPRPRPGGRPGLPRRPGAPASFLSTRPGREPSLRRASEPSVPPMASGLAVRSVDDMQSAPICLDRVTKRYGPITAVEDLSFQARAGAITGFLGPNGAGKSTTLRMLLGLATATAGSATILGRRYHELADPTTTVGAVLDATTFHPWRSARSHLRIIAAAAGVPTKRVGAVLDEVGLAHAAERRVGGFSLGMRQRLGLAGALLGRPRVLLLDEPANGLDPEGIRWLRSFLRDYADEGNTVLVSSHLLSEVQQTVDDVIVIARGRLRYQGPLEELNTRAGQTVDVRTAQATELRGRLGALGIDAVSAAPDTLTVSGATAEAVGEVAAL